MRPVQRVLEGRGDSVAWFFDNQGVAAFAPEGITVLHSVDEVVAWNPAAVFHTNNFVCDFFPGIKVQLFHGLDIEKRGGDDRDGHFRICGFFDLYCTHGPSSTKIFRRKARLVGHFRAVETGWPKIDNFFPDGHNGSHVLQPGERPTIMYSTTFTRGITSTPYLYEAIEELIKTRPWDWIITMHPLCDPVQVERYRRLAEYPGVRFFDGIDNSEILRRADVMVCDSSSIIVEFMSMSKPVVTFRNSHPGPHLIDINDPARLGGAIEKALTRPRALIAAIDSYLSRMHPHNDGKCSERVVKAVDEMIAAGGRSSLRNGKPLNLFRRWQMRQRMRPYGWVPFKY